MRVLHTQYLHLALFFKSTTHIFFFQSFSQAQDEGWGPWGDWSLCSEDTCTKTRTRMWEINIMVNSCYCAVILTLFAGARVNQDALDLTMKSWNATGQSVLTVSNMKRYMYTYFHDPFFTQNALWWQKIISWRIKDNLFFSVQWCHQHLPGGLCG